MSSTDPGGTVKPETAASLARIREFFDRELMPLAARLRAAARSPFPLAGEASAGSYYVKRQKTAMSAADFVVAGTAAVDDLEPALVQLWKSQRWPELAALAADIGRIARSVYFVEDRDDEVSPFMYVMF